MDVITVLILHFWSWVLALENEIQVAQFKCCLIRTIPIIKDNFGAFAEFMKHKYLTEGTNDNSSVTGRNKNCENLLYQRQNKSWKDRLFE